MEAKLKKTPIRMNGVFENTYNILHNFPQHPLDRYIEVLEKVVSAMEGCELNCSDDIISLRHEHEDIEYFEDELAYFESFL